MAYVVARRGGRFEIRESLHTDRGSRARTLAGFAVLSDEVLAVASGKARRKFDRDAVIASAGRAGAPMTVAGTADERAGRARERFLAGSRRMASSGARSQSDNASSDAGAALLELLGFADAVTAAQPRRPFEPLAFPPLARLAARRDTVVSARA